MRGLELINYNYQSKYQALLRCIVFGIFDNWAEKYVKKSEKELLKCSDMALGIDYALSKFTTFYNIKNNMDGSSKSGIILDFVFSKPGSLFVGNKKNAPIIVAFVIGATEGEIDKYFNIETLNKDYLSKIMANLIIYRYAVRGIIETKEEADILISAHIKGFEDNVKEFRSMGYQFSKHNYDEQYFVIETAEPSEPSDIPEPIITVETSEISKISETIEEINEYDEEAFEQGSNLLDIQMSSLLSTYQDEILHLTEEQRKKHFAFWLGVIEYLDRTFINISVTDEELAYCRFFNFSMYCSKVNFNDTGGVIGNFWDIIIKEKGYMRERELGFNSIANRNKNPGHYPGRYLKDAVGF